MANVCKHCQVRIVKINFALGEQWVHQAEGASGWDGQYQFCKLTTAEPLRLMKKCSNLAIHSPHEWLLSYPSHMIRDQLCYCEGVTIDIRKISL